MRPQQLDLIGDTAVSLMGQFTTSVTLYARGWEKHTSYTFAWESRWMHVCVDWSV